MEAFLAPHGSAYPRHLRTSIMYQSGHVRFPKTLTFPAILCGLFNPIPQGSEAVLISRARKPGLSPVRAVSV